jgi:CRP-like cAMP-binding protein
VQKDGGEAELRRLAPGDSVGQSGILAGVRTGVVVRALTRATVFRLDKSALTPILARRPEVAREMCRLLSVHHESEKMLLATSATADEGSGGLLQWIRDGVRRFHELAL